MHHERKKNRKTLQLMRQVQAAQEILPADIETGTSGATGGASSSRPVAEGYEECSGSDGDSSPDKDYEDEAVEMPKAWRAVRQKVVRKTSGKNQRVAQRGKVEHCETTPLEEVMITGQPLGEATDTILGSVGQTGEAPLYKSELCPP